MDETARKVILDLYDTVVNPSLWPDMLDRIANAVGARGCIVFEIDASAQHLSAPYYSGRYDGQLLKAYIAAHNDSEIADQSTFARHSLATDDIELIADDVLAESRNALVARSNSRAMADYGIHHRAGALLDKDHVTRNRFSLQFSKRHGPVGPSDMAFMRDVLPHVAKALDLGRPVAQMARRYRDVVEALDMFRLGVCILDAGGRVVLRNRECDRQVEETGILMVTREGRFRLASPAHQARFAAFLDDLRQHGRFGARPRKEAIVIEGGPDGRTLAIEVVPLRRAEPLDRRTGADEPAGFAVFSYDTGTNMEIDVNLVRSALSLTPAEGDLVSLLAEGLTNTQIAERRGRSVETVKAHIAAMLAKADCANRTQFLRLATNIGANFLRE